MDLFDHVERLAPQLTRRYGPVDALRYVDPSEKRGRMYHAGVRFARSSTGRFLARHVLPRIDPWLYRATGGRYPASLPVVLSAPLMTTGAKTCQPREVQVSYFHYGPDPILIASNYGGPKHPQWYYNLTVHSDCQFGDERFVATEVTDPDEYVRLYALAEKVFSGYGDYRAKTASVGRQIPLFRLSSQVIGS
jgi:deazaflavin-dependent oxidoreductase (nitroreductase family)